MAKKLKLKTGTKSTTAEGGSENSGDGELGRVIKDSAQEIWLAGLGAYARTQEEGAKVFETLVRAGQDLQQKTQSVAGSTVEQLASRAAGTWGKLEQVFEDRVARSINRLGVPSSKELEGLSNRVAELNKSVQSLLESQQPAAKKRPSPTGAAKSVARKAVTGAKKVSKPVVKRANKAAASMRNAASDLVAETLGKTLQRTMRSRPKR